MEFAWSGMFQVSILQLDGTQEFKGASSLTATWAPYADFSRYGRPEGPGEVSLKKPLFRNSLGVLKAFKKHCAAPRGREAIWLQTPFDVF